MARSSDSDDYHRSSRRRRYRSSRSSSKSSSSSSSDDSRERRRRRRSRSTSRRRRKSRDRSRERGRRSRSRSRRRSSSRDRRERSNKKDSKRRRTRSRSRRRRSSSDSADSRRRDTRKREDRRTEYADTSRACSISKEVSRDDFVVELPTAQNEAERTRAIDGINSASFSQQNFVSKRGQQSTKADEGVAGGGDSHMSAMFGTTSLEEFLAAQAKKPPKITDYKDTPELLLHENLYDEPERRLEKWKKKLQTERRKRLVSQNVPLVA